MSLHPAGIVLLRRTIRGPRWACRTGRHNWKSRLNAERCCADEWARKVVLREHRDTLNAHGQKKGPLPGTVEGWVRISPPRPRTRDDEIPEAEIPIRVRMAKRMHARGLYVSDRVATWIDRVVERYLARQARR